MSIAVLTWSNADSLGNTPDAEWVEDRDRSRAASRTRQEFSRRFLFGRSLIRALVANTTDLSESDYTIETNAKGKPYIKLASGRCGPAISLSHSGDVIIAATTVLGTLGVDVEYHRKNRSFDAIATFAFGPRERQMARKSREAFYGIWCLREALSKATGNGLAEAADRRDRILVDPSPGFWHAVIDEEKWLLALVAPFEDYSLAVSVRPYGQAESLSWSEDSLDIWHISPAELRRAPSEKTN